MTKPAAGKKAPDTALPEGARERSRMVLEMLTKRYPHPATYLHHETPWQLLVATALSAQCTDDRVNMVTPGLFSRWPGPGEMAEAPLADVEEAIRSVGLYRSKAKNITAAAKRVVEVYGGEPPKTIAELTTLPGVARKTANIVLSSGYGINEGIAVDTHVKRITHRLGLTKQTDPVKVERDLMQLFPQKEWGDINHRLVLFGRSVCTARSPKCGECEMQAFCPRLEPPKTKK